MKGKRERGEGHEILELTTQLRVIIGTLHEDGCGYDTIHRDRIRN
jgi:hypothetical protein